MPDREPVLPNSVKPKFTRNIQLGQVINFAGTIGLIWTVSNGIGSMISSQAAATAEFRRDIAAMQANLAKINPIVEAESRANAVQDQRIENIISAVQDLRTTSTATALSVTTAMATIQNDLSALKARQDIGPVRR